MSAITATTWAATTGISKRDYVKPTTGGNYWYYALNDGTTAGAEPTWPAAAGSTVVDNDITWQCVEVFQLTPDFTYNWQTEDDAVIVAFSGGYEQRTTGGRGIRYMFNCSFVNRLMSTDMATMKAFWAAQEGRRYTWIFQDPVSSSYFRVRFSEASIEYDKNVPAAVASWSFVAVERPE